MASTPTPYEILGGSDAVRAIVWCFYELMDSDPAYADLRAVHTEDLRTVRHGLAQFLDAWLGGPRDWFARGQCVMSLHRRLPISAAVAGQWADAMGRAIAAQPEIDPKIGDAMAARLRQMALAMANSEEPVAAD